MLTRTVRPATTLTVAHSIRSAAALIAALLCTVLAGCRSTHLATMSHNLNQGVLLGEAKDEDGTQRTWRVYPGHNNDPRIDMTASTRAKTPRLGVTVSAVTRKRAEKEGIEPWQGVWIDRVVPNYPAAKIGLVRGDIILKLAGQGVSSSEQFADLIANHAAAGEELQLTMHVRRKPGDPPGQPAASVLTIVPQGVEIRDSRTDSIPLEASQGIQHYTGLQVAEVPPDVARSLFNVTGPVVLISGVVTGSPAYDAGLRAGDRVVRCDGKAVGSLDDVRDAVHRRARRDYAGGPVLDLVTTTETQSQAEGDVALEVLGPLGAHATELGITDEIDERTRFHVPIVVNYRSSVNHARFSFLDFIFQFGWNYRGDSHPSSTRSPLNTWELSLFPLGMFEFEKKLDSNRYCLFWLINFEVGA